MRISDWSSDVCSSDLWAPCTTTNADRTVHQGIEVGLDATIPLSALGDSLALTAAYTYSDFFFDDDAIYGDNRIPGVPKHYLRAELRYKHQGGFYAGPKIGRAPCRESGCQYVEL